MEFHKAKPISLKAHTTYNEKWLQARIAEDTSLLGLGNLDVKDIERRQPRAGRLDLLLSDPETSTRYEVEIQLGATDETHIIRTIEYWDIEKSRYPQYEHVAVIVAEDITSRFLNVINLLNKTIPLIAIQMRALEVNGVLTLTATTVLDLNSLGTDEEDEPGQATDRSYWLNKSSQATLHLADEMVQLVNQVVPDMTLKYNKHYVGLARNGVADNFVIFRPAREHLVAQFRIERTDDVTALIEDSGIDALSYNKRRGRYGVRLSGSDLTTYETLLKELIERANGSPSVVDD
jgi:hypothetical protein